MNFRINRDAIIFLERDRDTGFQTVAYDWQSGDLYAIRPLEYGILYFIYEHESVSRLDLQNWTKGNLTDIQLDEIIEILINKKIILIDE